MNALLNKVVIANQSIGVIRYVGAIQDLKTEPNGKIDFLNFLNELCFKHFVFLRNLVWN